MKLTAGPGRDLGALCADLRTSWSVHGTLLLRWVRVTPALTWAIMTSRLLVQIIVNLIMTVLVVIIGGIVHSTIFTLDGYLLIACVSIMDGAMFLAIAQAIVGLIRSAAAVNAVGRVFYIVFLLLGLLGASGILGRGRRHLGLDPRRGAHQPLRPGP